MRYNVKYDKNPYREKLINPPLMPYHAFLKIRG